MDEVNETNNPMDALSLQGVYPQDTLRLLQDARAILENDHFVYISGDHGSGIEAVRQAGGDDFLQRGANPHA